mmetsp:Transcript_13427/g.19592  ORF Transcript_13427/g.19592 Transcript_13427/m.19592 type:complete len:430 (-) Transcript_13427:13-1302(-)
MPTQAVQSFDLKLYKILASSKWDSLFVLTLLTFEALLTFTIVRFVPYTEIDWDAYMQEVSMWQEGELDYVNIRGGTGPLVYPAGFLYLYGVLKWFTDGGDDVKTGQYLFCILYLANAATIFFIYTLVGRYLSALKSTSSNPLMQSHTIWSWRVAMVITCLSKRIHSIFVLRLFNDAPCMYLFYTSAYLFAKSKWRVGCVFFSLAVSIKMNVLLFAPGLLLLLLQSSNSIVETIICLAICAGIQLVLGAPFLLTYPISYIRKAFEFDRIFFYEWTVNWKFLSVEMFTSKSMSILLLMLHIAVLSTFAIKWIQSAKKELGGKAIFVGQPLNPTYIIYTLFVSNYIGVAFARTLHYQFYSWYFHSIPFMLWVTKLPIPLKLLTILMVEYAFNVFPATPFSSAILQFGHGIILLALWCTKTPHLLHQGKVHSA